MVSLIPELNIIIKKKAISSDLTESLHTTFSALVLLAWIMTTNINHFITSPGLTKQLNKKPPFPSLATA